MFTREDLLAEGWPESASFDALLAEAERLVAQGNTDRAYVLKRLDRLHPRRQPTLTMRKKSLPFAEAVEADSREAEKNLRIVRRTMRELMACPVVEAGALMPDACPAGSAVASIPVGGAVAVREAIIPAAHGSDICCSLYASFFEPLDLDVSEMMDRLVKSTRFGPGGRAREDWVTHPVSEEPVWENPFLKGLQKHARMHLADQGDGNHFAFLGELQTSEALLETLQSAGHNDFVENLEPNKRYFVLVTHHGSRGLGAQVYKRAQEAAVRATKAVATGVPEAASWLAYPSGEGRAYWDALQYLSRWTRANHELIHQRFLEQCQAEAVAAMGNEHNFVWKRGNLFLHGKGATPAWLDDAERPLLGLIPLNMANPVLMVLGGNQEDYLAFGPHGAGRHLSRRALLRRYRLKDGSFDEDAMAKDLKQTTAGLDVRWFRGRPDVAESPIGYKEPATVRAQIEQYGLAKVVAEIHPLGSVMAGRGVEREEEWTPKQRRQREHRSQRRRLKQRLNFIEED